MIETYVFIMTKKNYILRISSFTFNTFNYYNFKFVNLKRF